MEHQSHRSRHQPALAATDQIDIAMKGGEPLRSQPVRDGVPPDLSCDQLLSMHAVVLQLRQPSNFTLSLPPNRFERANRTGEHHIAQSVPVLVLG